MKSIRQLLWMVALVGSVAQADSARAETPGAPKFRVLVLAESGGHHVEFTKAARPWLKKCGEENGFEVDYVHDTSAITKAFLAKYRLVLQLDYVPYGWAPEAKEAFQDYIEHGRGGWVGLHHATLLGDFDGQSMVFGIHGRHQIQELHSWFYRWHRSSGG